MFLGAMMITLCQRSWPRPLSGMRFQSYSNTPVSQASLVLSSSYLPSRLVDEAGPWQRLNGALQPFEVGLLLTFSS